MQLKAIGTIHSPYKNRGDAPRQGRLSDSVQTLEVFAEYAAGLKGIEEHRRLIVLYWGDRAKRSVLQSPTPFHAEPVGVFSSRSPNRPNPIAFCVADLIKKEGNQLMVRGVDALDGSPLLDLKAYSPSMDAFSESGVRGSSSDAGYGK
jgi:tRNA-Thr(GGU) m(6)t(6)A37 methyltransferase TsaA